MAEIVIKALFHQTKIFHLEKMSITNLNFHERRLIGRGNDFDISQKVNHSNLKWEGT